MPYLALFRMPTQWKITGRSSTITNAFINAIIPVVPPTSEQVQEALTILGMTPDSFQCAYCGAIASEWDHLRPLVKGKKPTGYISEIHNLVPACGKCNQSKGNKDWKVWMLSNAKLSPTARGVAGVEERIERLEAYEKWCAPTQMNFESVVGEEVWARHLENLERVQSLMRESQELASTISGKPRRPLNSNVGRHKFRLVRIKVRVQRIQHCNACCFQAIHECAPLHQLQSVLLLKPSLVSGTE